jgi:serine/threonine protein kinase
MKFITNILAWDLDQSYGAGSVEEMRVKYELRGPKQGEEDLGEGRAGVVRKCILKASSDVETGSDAVVVRACKCISKKQQTLEETQRELDIMKKLVGKANVSQLLDVFEAPDRLFLISELCEGGELYSQVIERANEDVSRPFTEKEAAVIMKQVMSTPHYFILSPIPLTCLFMCFNKGVDNG